MSDDVEDPTTVWTPSLEGTVDASIAWQRVAVSAFDHHWNAPTGPVTGIAWLTSPALQVAASGTVSMTFHYRHAFEFAGGNFDGGVIEVSLDNGTTWSDVETVIGAATVYNGTITTLSDNPLGGRRAFVGESAGFPAMLAKTINFPATLLGKTVRVRFGAATDSFGNLTGWDLDDFSFAGLVNTPFPGYVDDANACAVVMSTAGTPQSATVGTPFAIALQVQLTRLGAPVVGAAVHFSAPAVGATGTFPGAAQFADVVTDASGFATAPAFTANGTAGAYTVFAQAGLGAATFSLTNAAAVNPARLDAISTRMDVLTGDNVAIGGFIIGGSTPKTVVVRGRGPSLAGAGVAGVLANPLLQIVRSSDQTVIATNDDWQDAANAADIVAAGFAPGDAHESAVMMTLDPGAYTAIVSGVGGTTGVAIVEIFEVDHPEVPIAGISTRGRVDAGDNVLIGGIIVQGAAPQTVVIRARGPSLAGAGVAGVLVNPTLILVRSSDNTVVATNDDWQSGPGAAAIQAAGLQPGDPAESAILITLDPGAYTAIVTGAGGTAGVAIVEVFTTQ